MIPTEAPLAYPPRTTPIYDRKRRDRVIGEQIQTVFTIGEVESAVLQDVDPSSFEFIDEQVIDGNTIPAHWKGRVQQTDVILRGGVEPAEVLTGQVELRLFQTENCFRKKAIGEKGVRADSIWHFLRVTFMGPPQDDAELQELTLGHNEPPIFDQEFGPAKKGNSIWVSNATQLEEERARLQELMRLQNQALQAAATSG
ncbi:MAG TPA: hypothetical protein VJB64_01710 [Patescibacteria group bacterium]|nr:hypothetical protein [Patescibacteria group bacterium]